MEFIKLLLSQNYKGYSYIESSNTKMGILGLFLTDDVGCSSSPFKEWAFNDSWGDECSGNITRLEKEDDYILLTDLYPDEEIPSTLRMTRQQYVQVITEWEEKVCKLRPKEVIIKYENEEFIMETKN